MKSWARIVDKVYANRRRSRFLLGPETEAISELNAYSYGIGQATQRVCVDTFDPPQPYLCVCKDINVNGGLTGVASISNFFQTFSVPEPCTLLVLAVGGALALRSKRH